MAGIKALFKSAQVRGALDEFIKDAKEKQVLTLKFLGEKFVNEARLNGNYTDRTGNLRSSIGYIILDNGQIADSNFEGTPTGSSNGRKVADEVAISFPNGLVLIGVAGMQYAAYVEAKNFDVISGSAPGSEDLKSILNAIKS